MSSIPAPDEMTFYSSRGRDEIDQLAPTPDVQMPLANASTLAVADALSAIDNAAKQIEDE